jgi:hypothetical protein
MRYKLKNSTLVGYFVNMLTDEYAKLKNEFKDIFEAAPVEPRLSMQPNSVTHLWNRRIISAFGGEDEITFKKLLNEFQRYNNDDVDVSMWANYKTDLENGIVKTTDLSIDINFEVLRADIVYNLEMLELVEENDRLSLGTAGGHKKGYILNVNGRRPD